MANEAFFGDVEQAEIPTEHGPLKVPVFYRGGSAMTAVFPARTRVLRGWLPDPRFVPARLGPGVAAVTITAFAYPDSDIGPYNELAISVPLAPPGHGGNLPGQALLAGLRRRQFHAWVQHLPVTTEIARAGGVEFYNYPKFLATIEIEERGGTRTSRLEEGGQHILTLRGRTIRTDRTGQLQLFSHLWMDAQPQGSEFKLDVPRLGLSSRPGEATLELGGAHPIARELAGALLSTRSLHLQYLPRFDGILYGPDRLSVALLQRVLHAEMDRLPQGTGEAVGTRG